MASLIHEGLILNAKWNPLVQSVRFGRRVNVQKPAPPHYERAKVLALLKPQYKEVPVLNLHPALTCKKSQEINKVDAHPDNPLERIFAQELFERMENSKFIGLIHVNPISGSDKFEGRIKLRREGFDAQIYSKHTLKRAIEGTKYQAIMHLFQSHNAIIYNKEPKVAVLLRLLKKIPQYILMAAIVEGKLLSLTQIENYAKLKDLTNARAQLVSTLNCLGSTVHSQLQQRQMILVSQLDELAKLKKEESDR